MPMDIEKNIIFLLEECEKDKENDSTYNDVESFIEDLKMQPKLSNNTNNNSQILNDYEEFSYFKTKQSYFGDDTAYYHEACNVKDLLTICDYYAVTKMLKLMKLTKKNDIVEFIINYENSPENFELVYKRHRLWAYIEELDNHPFMKQYILWK